MRALYLYLNFTFCRPGKALVGNAATFWVEAYRKVIIPAALVSFWEIKKFASETISRGAKATEKILVSWHYIFDYFWIFFFCL